MGSLRFSEKQALSTSTKLAKFRQSQRATKVIGVNLLRNADSVINFLHQEGFTKPQIRNVVSSVPQILTSRIEQNLGPKMKFFQELGLSGSDFVHVILNHPGLLGYGLDSAIRPAVEALREIMGSNDDVIRAIKGFRMNALRLVTKHLVRNVSSLQAQGISMEAIRNRILKQASPFFQRPELFKDIMVRAEEKWGVSPSSSRFLPAVHVLIGLNEKTIESKFRVFESFGWERSDVLHLFRLNPYSLAASDGMIEAKLSFFMNELGYDPGYMATKANLMNCSFKKRALPRHLVLRLLKEKGLIRENLSLYRAISMTESQFLESFIHPFETDVPNLCKIYTDSIGSFAKEQDKSGKSIQSIKFKPYSVRECIVA